MMLSAYNDMQALSRIISILKSIRVPCWSCSQCKEHCQHKGQPVKLQFCFFFRLEYRDYIAVSCGYDT